MRFILKKFFKKIVTNEIFYKPNTRTAPVFLIKDEKKFDVEKSRLTNYVIHTQQLDGTHFHNKESHGFGKLTTTEWNNMFYKHLNHHLRQFGV